MSNHTGISANGIAGTATAGSGAAGINNRQARIKLDYNTSCDFASGTSFVFNAYANRPCSQAALGNGVSATTDGVDIQGVVKNGSAGMT